jgi:hypothetical protein
MGMNELSDFEKKFLLEIHDFASRFYNDIVAIFNEEFLNRMERYQKVIKDDGYFKTLPQEKRFSGIDISQSLVGLFIFTQVFSNEILGLKILEPLEEPETVMNIFPMICTNLPAVNKYFKMCFKIITYRIEKEQLKDYMEDAVLKELYVMHMSFDKIRKTFVEYEEELFSLIDVYGYHFEKGF